MAVSKWYQWSARCGTFPGNFPLLCTSGGVSYNVASINSWKHFNIWALYKRRVVVFRSNYVSEWNSKSIQAILKMLSGFVLPIIAKYSKSQKEFVLSLLFFFHFLWNYKSALKPLKESILLEYVSTRKIPQLNTEMSCRKIFYNILLQLVKHFQNYYICCNIFNLG